MFVRLLALIPLFAAASLSAEPMATNKVIAVNIDGVVHPITAEIVGHAIDQAEAQSASALLIRLNTPGGLIDATRKINERLSASRVPIITYVTPSGGRAASAGFIILIAGDVAAMAPGTNTGAASPVLIYGTMDETMRHKVENDLSASVRALAGKRGPNAVAEAVAAVMKATAYTDSEALENRLVELIASSDAELLRKLDGREVKRLNGSTVKLNLTDAAIAEYQPTLRERVISAASDPNLAFMFLVLGVLGIYVEFNAPGMVVPGVFGGILALLGLNGLMVMPINWMGAAMMVLGVTCFVLEAKYPSHGIIGLAGAIALSIGAMVLIDAPPALRIRPATAIGVTLPFAVITLFLVTLAMRARNNKVITGVDGMLSEIGIAFTPLAPAGKIFVHGEYWDAESTQPVEKGAQVKVIAIDGLRLKVEPR